MFGASQEWLLDNGTGPVTGLQWDQLGSEKDCCFFISLAAGETLLLQSNVNLTFQPPQKKYHQCSLMAKSLNVVSIQYIDLYHIFQI